MSGSDKFADPFTGTLITSFQLTKPFNSLTIYSATDENVWYII
jgi:hypothetical protein